MYGIPESNRWFLDAVLDHQDGSRKIEKPKQWSNHRRNWTNGDWKNQERLWQDNTEGWHALAPGSAEAPILAVNLNTFLSAAGTPYWPELKGKILLIEEMDAPLMKEDRALYQLKMMGVFDSIGGLIMGKPEIYDRQGAPFGLRDLLLEVIGRNPKFPIVTDIDCSHTVPMLTVPQLCRTRLSADLSGRVEFEFLEPACSND